MAKSSKKSSKKKNQKKQQSGSTSPQVNAPTKRSPNGPNRRTRVADAINAGVTGVRQLVSSGLKALTGRQNQNQGSDAMVQQGDASTVVNASSVNVLDDPNLRTNTTLEHGAEDPNTSLLSELGSRTPRFGTNTVLGGLSPTQNNAVPGIVPSTQPSAAPGIIPSAPPRLNTSDASGTSSVGTGPSIVQEHCVGSTAGTAGIP